MKAFLVWGAESTGTRLMARLLCNYGCMGSYEHLQYFDNELPDAQNNPIVWRRSVPHAGQWPEFQSITKQICLHGFEPHIVITIRDLFATAKSQINVGHVQTFDEAVSNYKKAYLSIFSFLSQWPQFTYSLITYESLILNSVDIMRVHFAELSLKEQLEVLNQNTKWYA